MKSENAYTVPAVVVGGGLNALGVVRSLGAAGVPTILVTNNPAAPVAGSRYAREVMQSAVEGPELLDTLAAIARRASGKPVLFLTEERTVRTVSEHRDVIAPAYRVRMPEHDRLMALMHKQGFQELAEIHAAPVPSTVHLRSHADLPRLRELSYPAVLKPAKKDYDYGARFKKAYVVQSAREVEELYDQIAPVLPDMVTQQWIDGEDSDIYFTLQYVGAQGETVSTFTGRKIRSWPPRIGGTASCTAAWNEAAELDATTARFFQQVGFTGMGSMEYKRDRRDGRFYMIEPTVARTDFQEEVATIHGVNIPLAAYRYECGTAQDTGRAPPRPVQIVWREHVSDRRAMAAMAMEGGATEFSKIPACNALWRYSDPGPGLYWLRNWCAARWRGARRRILGAA